MEADENSRSARVVPIKRRRIHEVVHHDVQIPISVEIADSGPLRHGIHGEAPSLGNFFKSGIPTVAEGQVGRRQLGEGFDHFGDLRRRLQGAAPLGLGDAPRAVAILEIAPLSIGDEQVLEPIQVDVQDHRPPGPFAGFHPSLPGDIRPGAIAAVELQDVPLDLGPIRKPSGLAHHRGHARRLSLPPGPVATEHVHGEEIDMAIAIEIAEVDAHGKRGIAPQGHYRQFAKAQAMIWSRLVNPDAVRGVQVVADIQVGFPVARHILEARTQTPVPRRGQQGFAGRVQKGAVGPRGPHKTTPPLVQEHRVDFTHFDHLTA